MRINNKNINKGILILVVLFLLYSSIALSQTSIELTTGDWINIFGNINLTDNSLLNVKNLSVSGDINVTGSLIVGGENITASTNISVLYGNNGTSDVPLLVDSSGALVMSVVEASTGRLETSATGVDLTLTGDLTVDINTLFVDSTNNRVGILTTTPYNELTVIGDVSIAGSLNASSINVTGNLQTDTFNVTNPNENATFQGDVNIIGTLYGTSPLKIGGGINVSGVPAGQDAFFVSDSKGDKIFSITDLGGINISSSAGNTSFDENTLLNSLY